MANEQPNPNFEILGIDWGGQRIGLARAGSIAKLPERIGVIKNDKEMLESIRKIIQEHDIRLIVVGIPKNLKGEETRQSSEIRNFGKELSSSLRIKVMFADETLTTVKADQEKSQPADSSNDSLAACYILEEFFNTGGME